MLAPISVRQCVSKSVREVRDLVIVANDRSPNLQSRRSRYILPYSNEMHHVVWRAAPNRSLKLLNILLGATYQINRALVRYTHATEYVLKIVEGLRVDTEIDAHPS